MSSDPGDDRLEPPGRTDTDRAGIDIRLVNGVECTDRAGIAVLAGWRAGNSVHVHAGQDPGFPRPMDVPGKTKWYPLAGPGGVDEYLSHLAERDRRLKPPPVLDGPADEMLSGPAAAKALRISPATLRSYVRYSVPYWAGEKSGRPLLPLPDEQTTRDNGSITRSWRRATLATHQASRPGPGKGAGRPASTATDD